MLFLHILQTTGGALDALTAVPGSGMVAAFDPHGQVGSCADSLHRKIGIRLEELSATVEQQAQASFPLQEPWYCAFFHCIVVFATLRYLRDNVPVSPAGYGYGPSRRIVLESYLHSASDRLREAADPLRQQDDWRCPFAVDVIDMIDSGTGVGSSAGVKH